MKINDIKREMLSWSDYYGGDIMQQDQILKCKTKKQLSEVMENHIRFLEMQNIDALTHAENFKKSMGL